MGITPEDLEERLSYKGFVELRAFYALRDPEKRLEKEIEYREAYEEIMLERAERNKAAPP